MKFIKKHKSLVLALIVFVIVLVMFLVVYRTFFPEEETAIYGSRLEGIKDVEISKSTFSKIEGVAKDISQNTTTRVQGRILNISISIKDNVSRDDVKAFAPKFAEQLSKKQVEYYDIQLFVTKEGNTDDKASFPIIGYKHHSLDNYTWTKDR